MYTQEPLFEISLGYLKITAMISQECPESSCISVCYVMLRGGALTLLVEKVEL